MKKYYLLLCFLICLSAIRVDAQFTNILTFGNYFPATSTFIAGEGPRGDVTYYGKKLYGMTNNGGANAYGCIFCVDTTGNNYKDLHDFNDTLGSYPGACGVVCGGGKLFGWTYEGGTAGFGVIFSIDTNGRNFKVLKSLDDSSGYNPYGNLLLVKNILYGASDNGGRYGGGTVLSIDTNGSALTVLHHLGYTNDGYNNYQDQTGLILIGNKLYGTTSKSATSSYHPKAGIIYSINTDGSSYRIVTYIQGTDDTLGFGPLGSLTLVKNKFYGFGYGGKYNDGTIFSVDTDGTNYDTVMCFNGTNGSTPRSKLTLLGGKLYGMTRSGGASNYGTLFSIDTTVATLGYQDLYDFSVDSGYSPWGSLTLSSGVLYGMTNGGGPDFAGPGSGYGTIFRYGKGAVSGVNELATNSSSINIYPNPSTGKFTIQLSGIDNKSSIIIYNALGEQVYTGELNSTRPTIDLSGKPAGIYLYRILSKTGESVKNGKMIIQ